MKDIFEKIFSKVQLMSDAEFTTELARYKNDEVVVALSEMERVLAQRMEASWMKGLLSAVWSLTSRSDATSPLAVDDFEDYVPSNAANDERFALAA
ncbi:hypothetical protein [Variovorax paradoxus]|uniref:hypothetical protein n=1 Tax=Variovorax paradoxus TaxID=34073 RepID=UPI00285CD776|nr:hypothetical protein [Variovorax paradoxus]MDR6453884.1 hypothetical protein [Variovorax paradoxus]